MKWHTFSEFCLTSMNMGRLRHLQRTHIHSGRQNDEDSRTLLQQRSVAARQVSLFLPWALAARSVLGCQVPMRLAQGRHNVEGPRRLCAATHGKSGARVVRKFGPSLVHSARILTTAGASVASSCGDVASDDFGLVEGSPR